ncbi:MAG: hypothetical protein ACW986_13870 [Promethearchaeota archaeon]|jgi:hypothetical protein
MKEFLIPEKLKHDILTGHLSKDKAADLLISLIEGSDDTNTRVSSIKVLENLEFRDERIFKTLENYLVSDEEAILRAAAAEYIILNFLDEGITPLKWVIQHDKSPLVLQVYYKLQHKFGEDRFGLITDELQSWKERFASVLGISPEESSFFFDVEAYFAEDKRNYEIDPSSYKYYQELTDFKGGEPWLIIQDEHVEVLNFNYYKWKFIRDNLALIHSFSKLIDLDFYINSLKKYSYKYILISIVPESLGNLTHLRKLILKRNGLENLPLSLKKLTNLEDLDLSHNEFNEIPPLIQSLISLKRLNLKHNKIKIIPDLFQSYLASLESIKI